ncbi:MAG: XrtA system polysaccharide deacetylase [Pseudobdellovibrionaceae bacterium]
MASSIIEQQHKNKIALSFDVEDWFTVRNMREHISFDDWQKVENRIHVGMDFILDSLASKNIKATFFILGWVADQFPDLVRRIDSEGHEIACHGYGHTPIDLLEPGAFKKDLQRAMQSLENITGKKVKGFRAPSFSVTHKTAWALDIMQECGLEYDSSIFCTTHPDYGIDDFPTHLTTVSGLIEVPLKKNSVFGVKLPVCGGGYFRMLPYLLTKFALNSDMVGPRVMYFHPWEFDSKQPRVKLPWLKRFRHYIGLKQNKKKFLRLLNDFEFTTIEKLISTAKENNQVSTYNF